MRISILKPADLPELHALFQALCAPIRHGFPPEFDEFARPLVTHPPHLRHARVLVAEEDAHPIAFARIGTARQLDRWTFARAGDALLFGPFFAPGRADAGRSILHVAMRRCCEPGAGAVWAFDPCEAMSMPAYNGGVGLLSEELPHIAHLLAAEGFRVRHRELCMELAEPAAVGLPAETLPGMHLERGRWHGENTLTLVDHEGQRVGECRFSLMSMKRSMHSDARTTGYIDALAVVDRRQGCGFGRCLLTHALRDLAAMGATAVRLTTGADNLRAQGLYYSVGFAVIGSCITLGASPNRIRPDDMPGEVDEPV